MKPATESFTAKSQTYTSIGVLTLGDRQQQQFADGMRKIAVGAMLRRLGGKQVWRVLAAKRRETSTEITIGAGMRTRILHVTVRLSGPCLMDIGMEPAPSKGPTP